MRLVLQVHADDGGVAVIALGEAGPGVDPLRLGEGLIIPGGRSCVRPGARAGAVAIEDDLHPDIARVIHDLVEDAEAGQP